MVENTPTPTILEEALENLIRAAAELAADALAEEGIELLPDDVTRIKLVLQATIGAGPPLAPKVEQRIMLKWSDCSGADLPLVLIGERCPSGPHRHSSRLHQTECDIRREIAADCQIIPSQEKDPAA